jgi:hypothetical protein
LLREIPLLEDNAKAYEIQTLLWVVRSAGVILSGTTGTWRFVPIIGPTGVYDSDAEFDEVKKKYFTPYQTEISYLLKKITSRY